MGHQKKKADEKEQGTFHINKNSVGNQVLAILISLWLELALHVKLRKMETLNASLIVL